MKATTLLRFATVWLLLLSSCLANKDSLSPATPASVTTSQDIRTLQQIFSAKNYARQLTFTLKDRTSLSWTPRWDQSFQRNASTPTAETYIPLELPALQWIGVKKYLVIRQVEGKADFSEATYVFKEQDNPSKDDAKPVAFLDAFTGVVDIKSLATGMFSHRIYKTGVQQAGPNVPSAKRTTAGNATSSCYNVVTCQWDGYCTLSDLNNTHYGTVTTGIDYCDSPDSDAAGCSQIQWSSSGSSIEPVCDGGGSSGGGGGSGGGGSAGDTGPDYDPMYNNDSKVAYATTENPTIGDTRIIMSKNWDSATVIKVVLEYTKSSHSVDKLTITSVGVVAATKFAQVGNGIASWVPPAYANRPNDGIFKYSATFQQVVSTGATGDVLGGPIFEVFGNYSPYDNAYTINFRRL